MTQYRSRWPKELDLNKGDLIQVLFKEDETWWFGRLKNGSEGYFPTASVEPLQVIITEGYDSLLFTYNNKTLIGTIQNTETQDGVIFRDKTPRLKS